jgi:hypothetical protein
MGVGLSAYVEALSYGVKGTDVSILAMPCEVWLGAAAVVRYCDALAAAADEVGPDGGGIA